MFTGIVEELGTIRNIQHKSQGAILEIKASDVLTDAEIGDSIAVDGACLTVRSLIPEAFTADISAETLRRTTLGERLVGEQVNLERSLRLSDRLGGHLVLGHVDEVATICHMERRRRCLPDAGNDEQQYQTLHRLQRFYHC